MDVYRHISRANTHITLQGSYERLSLRVCVRGGSEWRSFLSAKSPFTRWVVAECRAVNTARGFARQVGG
jgi:hypothetical protein